MKLQPAWRVVVRHRRNSGRLGFFKSRYMTFTEARRELAQYEATGHECYLEADEDVLAINRQTIARDRAAEIGA